VKYDLGSEGGGGNKKRGKKEIPLDLKEGNKTRGGNLHCLFSRERGVIFLKEEGKGGREKMKKSMRPGKGGKRTLFLRRKRGKKSKKKTHSKRKESGLQFLGKKKVIREEGILTFSFKGREDLR